MKTFMLALALCTFCGLSNAQDFGKSKICSELTVLNTLHEEVSVSKVPEIENFNGQFQIEINKGDAFSITYNFLESISELQQNSQETILDLGNGRILHIAALSSVDINGKGPFSTPFIEK